MDSFDNFQYESASSYGGIGIVDDTSSVYTANTQDGGGASVDLSSLSLADYSQSVAHDVHTHHNGTIIVDEDFEWSR